MNQSFSLEDIPTRSGVYLMRGDDDRVLYVGKARNLRQRLRSYQKPEKDTRPQIRFLMERTARVETIVTDTEKEALLLENTLIKEHRPRYNVSLRDDKTYVSLRIDLSEEFPNVRVVRKAGNDGALYFGPYASSAAVRETLRQIYRIFPLRRLATEICRRRSRPCLYAQIGQCSAPCHGRISREEYLRLVQGAIDLLSGRTDAVLALLRSEMQAAAGRMAFEEAAQIRDRIAAIEQTVEKQKVAVHGGSDCDVFGFWGDETACEIVVLLFRAGRMIDRRNYRLEQVWSETEILDAAVQQFYLENEIPPLILAPAMPENRELLTGWLSEKKGRRVSILVPQRGERKELVDLACSNARELFAGQADGNDAPVLAEIAARLGLQHNPKRIECFDISNLQGTEIVGSMTVLVDGRPDKGSYRRYTVKSVQGAADDFASLAEVIGRRLDRGIVENDLPQLIVVDGGRGQLGVLEELIAERGLDGAVEIAGIAKARRPVKGREPTLRSQERFFRPGRTEPILFAPGSPALRALVRLRDEAHRFAITYHRQKRGKTLLASQLETIPGIGPQRRLALLRHFGSLQRIRGASVEEIAAIPGFGMAAAEKIVSALASSGAETTEVTDEKAVMKAAQKNKQK